MTFIEEYKINPLQCDRLIDYFKKANSVGLAKPGISSNGLNREVKASTDLYLGDLEKVGAPFSLWEDYHNELWKFVQDYLSLIHI